MELVPVKCRIPEHLIRLGKNQQWLSDKTGFTKERISEYVNLRSTNISLRRATLIAYYLKCHAHELYVWEMRHE
jgi:putative transcriptional regulator